VRAGKTDIRPSNDDTRPRFIDLWHRLRFRSDTLAEVAGVGEDVILKMFRGSEVTRSTAESVLAALSRLTCQEYTLETVRVNLDQEEIRNAE